MTAHPDDCLVVCWSEERRLYPQFENPQILNVNSPTDFRGRKLRNIWVTGPAFTATRAKGWDVLETEAWFQGAEIKHVDEYKESE